MGGEILWLLFAPHFVNILYNEFRTFSNFQKIKIPRPYIKNTGAGVRVIISQNMKLSNFIPLLLRRR